MYPLNDTDYKILPVMKTVYNSIVCVIGNDNDEDLTDLILYDVAQFLTISADLW